MQKESILITGANGQIGTVLSTELRQKYGQSQVLSTDISVPQKSSTNFDILDVLDKERLIQLVKDHRITQIYHLAAILSAKGEQNPHKTWDINMNGLFNILNVSREQGVKKVFFPSSIAVFGPTTPRQNTPQHTVLEPATVYGMSKVAGEYWASYYFQRYGLDVRSLRYPGIVGHQSMPGGGTTDYAVDIYHKAVKGEPFSCFLKPGTALPMIYMEDAIRATIELMEADKTRISIRTGYNLAGMSFTPASIVASIQRHIPEFEISYDPEPLKQNIAESWPDTIDDSFAQKDWGWKPKYSLDKMTAAMLLHLKEKYNATTLTVR